MASSTEPQGHPEAEGKPALGHGGAARAGHDDRTEVRPRRLHHPVRPVRGVHGQPPGSDLGCRGRGKGPGSRYVPPLRSTRRRHAAGPRTACPVHVQLDLRPPAAERTGLDREALYRNQTLLRTHCHLSIIHDSVSRAAPPSQLA